MNKRQQHLIGHIAQAIMNANLFNSKLNQDILRLEGYSNPKNRHLLNNLLELEDANYLEIGTWKGSTFISSLFENSPTTAYAIDNWSEFSEGAKATFLGAADKYLKESNYTFIEEDCFQVDLSKIKNPIDIYLFDGEHTYDSHYKSIDYYLPAMADTFILIVDDYDPVPNWTQVKEATEQSIKDNNLNILYDQHLTSNGLRNEAGEWWNGYYVALLEKNNE